MIGAGAVVGSMLLVTSVYAGVWGAPGYTSYKSAIKNTTAVDNVTERVTVSVEDNGKLLVQVNSTMKANKADHSSSADIALTNGGTEQSIQFFNQDDKQIIKTGGDFKRYPNGDWYTDMC